MTSRVLKRGREAPATSTNRGLRFWDGRASEVQQRLAHVGLHDIVQVICVAGALSHQAYDLLSQDRFGRHYTQAREVCWGLEREGGRANRDSPRIFEVFSQGWLHLKLLLVIGLSAFHGMCAGWTKKFARDANTKSHKFYRIANEVPTVLLVIIVILAIVKPF